MICWIGNVAMVLSTLQGLHEEQETSDVSSVRRRRTRGGMPLLVQAI